MFDKITSIQSGREFDDEVLKSPRPAVVVFYATWCEDSQELSAMFDLLLSDFHKNLLFFKVNVDEQVDLGERYGVKATPTVLMFHDALVRNDWVNEKNRMVYHAGFESMLAGRSR